ncbi:MAG: sarcosine oxidase subunit alpha, partial [Mesorhizobium sp.]
GLDNVTLMRRTMAFGTFDGNTLGLIERRDGPAAEAAARQVFTMLRARSIVFATGAIERPLVFSNNDRPGVMLASAARTYLNRFAVLPGKNIAVATTHDGAYRAAFDLAAAGAEVTVADQRGAMTGRFSTTGAIEDGHRAGIEAASSCGKSATVPAPLKLDLGEAAAAPFRAIASTGRGKAFVDFQMDVTERDIELAHREGYESVEHLKRYTTLGMGTDQGKTSNFAALSAMAALRQATIAQTGTTTFRPPYAPVAIGALAGRAVGHHFKPIRRTPMHDRHMADGAEMLEVGLWMRPYFYRGAGRDVNEAYVAEMRMVRETAGLMDISTLGKIDVQGPDAASFLDRVYANGFARLPIGRARYGVMLRDDGIVFDDGTTTRLSETRFFMTTSTAKAADVLSRLEFLLDTAWPEL